MKLTIGVKALNEERHIAAALDSALAAAAPYDGEVILADSGSTDATIAIARARPVRILQLANPAERCCGAGAQLAFQEARGDFFYLLDGDMRLDPGFIAAGIAYLEDNPRIAAVGGRVREVNTDNAEFRIRARTVAADRHWRMGAVDRLDCGGLYRAAAVRQAGYFADRNLHAFEEFELGARLRALGWGLARIDVPAVDHHGHRDGGYRLLWKRVRSGYAGAPGEVLRGAIGTGRMGRVVRSLAHIRHGGVVMLWWLALAVALALRPIGVVPLLLAPFLLLWWRRGSPGLALYSLASWNVTAWGLIGGALRPRIPPDRPIAAIDLSDDQIETR